MDGDRFSDRDDGRNHRRPPQSQPVIDDLLRQLLVQYRTRFPEAPITVIAQREVRE